MTTIKSNLFEGYDMIIIKIRSGANILLWFKAAKGNHPQNVDYLPIIIYYLSISIDFFHMFHVFFSPTYSRCHFHGAIFQQDRRKVGHPSDVVLLAFLIRPGGAELHNHHNTKLT